MGAISTELVSSDKYEENPERSTDEIRQEIYQHRAAISKTINQLDDRFQKAVDWRTHVSEHPMVALGVAAGIGLIISGAFKPKPSPQDRLMDALADGVNDVRDQVRDQISEFMSFVPRRRPVWQGIAMGLLTKALTSYLQGKANSRTDFSHTS